MNKSINKVDTLRKIWEQRPEPENTVLAQRQKFGLESFIKQGFPNKKNEKWKYTDLKKLEKNYSRWLARKETSGNTDPKKLISLKNSIHIAIVDGTFRPDISSTLPKGVYAGSINDLINTNPDLISNYWGNLAKDEDNGLISLNSAFSDTVVLISIAKEITLEHPLYLNFIGTISESVIFPRVLIHLKESSKAEIIEHYTSNQPRIVNAVTEINCEPRSRLIYCKIQQEHEESSHTSTQYASLDKESYISSTSIDVGAELSRNESKIILRGQGSQAKCNGLLVANTKNYVESRIDVEHAAPDTKSREKYKSILSDQAKGVFNGGILVDKDGKKTDAALVNRNLLLSEAAEINAKPELEIYADDVKCTHGSTTGQLSEDELFYLLTRGISLTDSHNILIQAFAGEILENVGIELRVNLRQHINRMVGISS